MPASLRLCRCPGRGLPDPSIRLRYWRAGWYKKKPSFLVLSTNASASSPIKSWLYSPRSTATPAPSGRGLAKESIKQQFDDSPCVLHCRLSPQDRRSRAYTNRRRPYGELLGETKGDSFWICGPHGALKSHLDRTSTPTNIDVHRIQDTPPDWEVASQPVQPLCSRLAVAAGIQIVVDPYSSCILERKAAAFPRGDFHSDMLRRTP